MDPALGQKERAGCGADKSLKTNSILPFMGMGSSFGVQQIGKWPNIDPIQLKPSGYWIENQWPAMSRFWTVGRNVAFYAPSHASRAQSQFSWLLPGALG